MPAVTEAGFATAFQVAVQTSGLGLEQIQRRLGRQGHDVSLASLSYWRSGRSRPSRTSSIAAVAALEPILGVAPGSLTGLLVAGAHRSSVEAPTAGNDAPVEPVLVGLEPGRLPSALADLLLSGRVQVELVSDHQSVTIDAERRCTQARSRRIYRALVDGVDRVLVATSLADGVPEHPGLVARGRGRPGASVVLVDHGVTLTELLLERVLRRGDAIMLELDLDRSSAAATTTPRELAGANGLRELVVEVRFDPRVVPVRCEWFETTADGADEHVTVTPLDANALVLVLRHDVRAPRHGVRWVWAQLTQH